MIHYRKVLELHDEGISLRGIAESTENSRQKITLIIHLSNDYCRSIETRMLF